MAISTKYVAILYQLNDQFVYPQGLADGLNPTSYFNDATGTATLWDTSQSPRVAVAHATNIPLSYQMGSNGNYLGLIEQTFNPPVGSNYVLTVDLSRVDPGGDGTADAHWEFKAKVMVRNV